MHKNMKQGQPKQFLDYCETANSQLTPKPFQKIQHF